MTTFARGAVDLAVALVFAIAAGCESEKVAPVATTTSPAPSSAAAAPATLSAATTSAPSASSSAHAEGDLGGTWEGSYDAKKSTIALPAKVKPDALGADDGKVAVGPGDIHLVVSASGEVRGKLSGALGAATITGKVDGGVLRASIRPDDPRASIAMTGVLIGLPKADAIVCDLHVAGPDGGMIRESTVQLKRKP